MRGLKRWFLVLVTLLTIASTLAPIAVEAQSWATDCKWPPPGKPVNLNGRPDCFGYFSGQPYPMDDSWTNVLPNGLFADNLSELVSIIRSNLFSTTDAHMAIGGAFLVNVMLGNDGYKWGCTTGQTVVATSAVCRSRGVSEARTRFAEWTKLVTYYDSKGLIDYNYSWNTPGTWYENSAYTPSIPDVTYHSKQPNIIPSIRFYDPVTGSDMMLQRFCGNMLGDANRLDVPNYILDPRMSTGAAPPWGGTVQNGQSYTLTAFVKNTGSLSPPAAAAASLFDSDATRLEVGRSVGGKYVRYNGVGSTIGGVGSQTTAPLPGGYTSTGCMGYIGATAVLPDFDEYGQRTCWYWNYANGLIKNSFSTQGGAVRFTIVGNPPEGQQICFRIFVKDYNFADADLFRTADPVTGDNYCFTVHNPRYPSVKTYNSDVHAGGSLDCNAPTTIAGITANPNADSFGDYIVSASVATNYTGFGSNGSYVAGSPTDILKLGDTGGYQNVCRPDLLKTATEAINGGAAHQTIPSTKSNWTVSELEALDTGNTGVLLWPTGSITISGTIKKKLTVIAPTGSITIGGNMTIGPGVYGRTALPSIGLIARDNINISYLATTVDGYLFANGIIHTCSIRSSLCNNQLVVHGFLMANEVMLERMGNLNSTGTQNAEAVVLTPQLYLNPPKFFDNAVDDSQLEGQGEKPPLY